RKPQGGQVQFINEDLDHPNRVLLVDVILQAMRQQRRLHPIFAIDEPMHRRPPRSPKPPDSKATIAIPVSDSAAISARFHTAWTQSSLWMCADGSARCKVQQ